MKIIVFDSHRDHLIILSSITISLRSVRCVVEASQATQKSSCCLNRPKFKSREHTHTDRADESDCHRALLSTRIPRAVSRIFIHFYTYRSVVSSFRYICSAAFVRSAVSVGRSMLQQPKQKMRCLNAAATRACVVTLCAKEECFCFFSFRIRFSFSLWLGSIRS